MRKALVTGGAGYVGSHLCEELLKKNYSVVAYDNLKVGSKKNLQDFKQNKNFKFIEGDVRDIGSLEQAVKQADIIYHLAAVVGVKVVVENPLENIEVNIDGVRNVCELALKHGKKKVLFTSSSEVYGKNIKVPLKEDTSESVYGSTKVTRWAYGMAKALGEQMLWAYADKGLPVAVVRYFNSYGPRGVNASYANVAPKFIQQALNGKQLTVHGDGKGTRCFCFVKDTVAGTILAAENLENDVVNIGDDNEITIVDLAKKIIKLTKSSSKIEYIPEGKVYSRTFESAKRRVPDLSKAKQVIGYNPTYDLDRGLKLTIAWTKNQ